MTKKIFRSIIAASMTVFLASLFITVTFLYGYFNKAQVKQLKDELDFAAANVEAYGADAFNSFGISCAPLSVR